MTRDGHDRRETARTMVARWRLRAALAASVVVLAASCQTATPPNIPLEWEYVTEKQRRVEDVRDYVGVAQEHLAEGNFLRARWYFRKAYNVSRSLTNRGLCKVGIAMAYFGSRDFVLAAEKLDEAIRQYGNYIPFENVLLFEYDIARNQFHRKKDILWSTLDDQALVVYRNLQAQAPYHAIAEQALFSAGELEMERGNHDAAVELFTQYLNRYKRPKFELDSRLNMATCLLARAKRSEGDPLLEAHARRQLEKVVEERCTPAQAKRLVKLRVLADEVKADQLLFLGAFYQRFEHWNPEASRRYLGQFVLLYPTDPRMDEVQRLLANLPAAPEKKAPVPEPKDKGERHEAP